MDILGNPTGLTENQLKQKVAELESLLKSGGIRVEDARQLADYRSQLEEIDKIRWHRRW